MSTPAVRRYAGRLAPDVGPADRRGNAAGSAGRLARGCGLVLLASAVCGCSLSLPMGRVSTDDAPTGSIDRFAAMLSPALDREDRRRARSALAVTLDPQGNGQRAGWANPQSGAHGSFTAVGPPFPHDDRVCRTFVGEIAAGGAPERRVGGSACRDGRGEWALYDKIAAPASTAS